MMKHVAILQQALFVAIAVIPPADPTYIFLNMTYADSKSTTNCAIADPANLVCLDSNLTVADSHSLFTNPDVIKDWTTPTAGDFVYAAHLISTEPSDTICDGTQFCFNHLNVIDGASKAAQVQDPTEIVTSSVPAAKNCLFQWMLGADPSTLTMPFTDSFVAKWNTTSMQDCQFKCMQNIYCDIWSFDASVDIDISSGPSATNCYLRDKSAVETAMNTPLKDASCPFNRITTDMAKIAMCPDGTTGMCAIASGKYISGKSYCTESPTPSLSFLQTGFVCNPTATTTSRTSGAPGKFSALTIPIFIAVLIAL